MTNKLIRYANYFISSHSASGKAASINVTFVKQSVQNGGAVSITAAFDPTFGDVALEDVACEYTDPAGGVPIRLTKLNRIARQIVIPTPPPPDSGRLSFSSAGNPMVLVISPVSFSDEKRQFYCILQYYNATTLLSITSKTYTLENVYSKTYFLYPEYSFPCMLVCIY